MLEVEISNENKFQKLSRLFNLNFCKQIDKSLE